jgi:integrase
MPRLINATPAYRRHKPSGQAVVTLSGVDHYCGPYGTRASRAEYDRRITEWLANGRRATPANFAADLTVAELVARYWVHARTYYRRPDGSPTTELSALKFALGPLVKLYGKTRAAEFGPLAFDAVRHGMIANGWGRKSINNHGSRIKAVFKWAVARELIPPSVHHGLQAVAGLRAGRSAARETQPVRPVPAATVDQTLPHLPPTVAAMVRLQLLTGARPGEVCALTTAEVDRAGDVWTIRPAQHKTAHHGHARTIMVGPQARAVLLPFLNLANPTAPIFSPAASEVARRTARSAARITPLSCGNRPGTSCVAKRQRPAGGVYDVEAYRRAIARACDEAFPPPADLDRLPRESRAKWKGRLSEKQREALAQWRSAHRWHPHQLRHTAATLVRAKFGVEAAQHVLGHAALSATEIYAEKSADVARAVALAVG